MKLVSNIKIKFSSPNFPNSKFNYNKFMFFFQLAVVSLALLDCLLHLGCEDVMLGKFSSKINFLFIFFSARISSSSSDATHVEKDAVEGEKDFFKLLIFLTFYF